MSERIPNGPPHFLADENLERAVVEGVRRARPAITFATVAEVRCGPIR